MMKAPLSSSDQEFVIRSALIPVAMLILLLFAVLYSTVIGKKRAIAFLFEAGVPALYFGVRAFGDNVPFMQVFFGFLSFLLPPFVQGLGCFIPSDTYEHDPS